MKKLHINLAILALIEPGPGEDSQCRPLLAAMAGNSRDPANNARLVPNNPTTAQKKTPASIAPLID